MPFKAKLELNSPWPEKVGGFFYAEIRAEKRGIAYSAF